MVCVCVYGEINTCGGKHLFSLMEISSLSSSTTLLFSFLITALSSNSSFRLREREREGEKVGHVAIIYYITLLSMEI